MKRWITILLLALLCGQAAADITMLLGPDGKPLPNGKYRLLIIPSDATKSPVNSVLDVGGSDAPVPPIVPPPIVVDTLDAKLTLLLASVEDLDKATTASKLKIAYEMTLQLTASSVTDANSLRGVMAGIEKGVLDSLKKTAGWQPWVTGLAELVKPLDFDQVKQTYQAAAAKLGGSAPIPPPVPPVPPVTTAVKALILLETATSNQQHEMIRQAIRNDASLSPKVLILDPDSKDENNQPDRQVAAAKAYLGNRPLPRVLLLDTAGSFVGDEALPSTPEAAKAWLAERGIK